MTRGTDTIRHEALALSLAGFGSSGAEAVRVKGTWPWPSWLSGIRNVLVTAVPLVIGP